MKSNKRPVSARRLSETRRTEAAPRLDADLDRLRCMTFSYDSRDVSSTRRRLRRRFLKVWSRTGAGRFNRHSGQRLSLSRNSQIRNGPRFEPGGVRLGTMAPAELIATLGSLQAGALTAWVVISGVRRSDNGRNKGLPLQPERHEIAVRIVAARAQDPISGASLQLGRSNTRCSSSSRYEPCPIQIPRDRAHFSKLNYSVPCS